MKDAIVEKLRNHLSGPMDTECKVVYLLCEIRKLLDNQRSRPRPFALYLYCCWALHVDLSHPPTTMRFLKKVDSYVYDKLNVDETNWTTLSAEHAIFREFLYLDTFKKELFAFLGGHDLPTALCDEDERWFSFLRTFGGVIEDGSLTCVSTGPDRLRTVDRVTFKGPHRTRYGHPLFGIKWDILLKDRRRLEVEVATQLNTDLRQWHLRIIPAN
jgi:hypothetical protein